MSTRIEYAPGEAWCIAAGGVVLVCERDLPLARARALHDAAAAVESTEGLRAVLDAEPAALLGLLDAPGGRTLLRRLGVPATAADAPLPDRFGAEWTADALSRDDAVAAGGLGALEGETLPFAGGVVRVAAVRVSPSPLQEPADAEPVTAAPTPAEPEPESPAEPESPGAFGQTLPPRVPPAPQPPTPAEPGSSITGLIDSVPGFIRPAVEVRAAEAPAPEGAAGPPQAGSGSGSGDHDGMTITAEQSRRLQSERSAPGDREPAPVTGPLVLSTLCPRGHVNAPGTDQCARCGARVDEGSAAQRRRPEVAVAVLPSGERIPLGRGVVVGRRPRSRRVEDGRVPRLVTVESPGEDVSRSHLELRIEDWNIVAIDLSSTNGTMLLRDGSAPQRLRPEASTIMQLGDRLDLGDGVVLTVEPVGDEATGGSAA